ncbi:X2-like carbohydrate binding domain-containing protein [Paenibacillus sp. LHD-117]|uniref:X2-like carbohydrate binding domain-containing protein n=1 Tax=Paenibacillus sp. LHD-117 TaxID=3071412 RepID=UPI0027DF51C0|nr:X2-like carbohydrate binding domain-containing protein [Paenibacillus sp. LHD-117]MDQ6421450.1 X2-like carbohydrate binding domain-containing protein [Paenibacillus sp. LHD-117]
MIEVKGKQEMNRLAGWMRKARIAVLAFVVLAAQLGMFIPGEPAAVEAASKEIAAKPYMGWSSYSMQVWDTYNGGNGGTWITAEQIKAQSDAMHEKLQPYGYEYINVDAAWNGGMDGYGRPIPSTTLFPEGLQDVIDHVHDNGQKFGLYIIPGLSREAYDEDLPIYNAPGCSMKDIGDPTKKSDAWGFGYKIDFSNECAQKYIDSIADLFAEWGVDFLKFDSVTPGSGISDLSLDARDDVKAWSKALEPHGIWFELSWALDLKYIDYWKQYSNGWRVDWDIECYCAGALTDWNSIARLFPIAEKFWRHAGPGGWNDFDSLNVGNGAMDGITPDERKTAMTFWSLSSAQLYTGNDMTRLDDYGLELLTNEEVIAVNQAGRPGRPVSTATPQQVWYANNGDGTYTVGLFNLADEAATVTANWSDIGLIGSASVRDLWSHEELGDFASSFSSADLAPHASRLLKVTTKNGTIRVNDDDTGMKYTGEWTRNSGKEMAADEQNLVIDVSDSEAADSTISPTTASFDKKEEERVDVRTTLTLNGNTLSAISNGGYTLQEGDDYTVDGSLVTIKKEYLASRPVGAINLTFTFSGGSAQSLVVTVSDTTASDSKVTPGAVSFDHAAQSDVALTLSQNGNTLTGATREGSALTEGTDYTASDTEIILNKDALAALPTGTYQLAFDFDGGSRQKVALVVRDTSAGGSISINNDDQAIQYSGFWNRSYNRGLGDYMDDVHFAEKNDQDYLEYSFTGTGIEYLTELDPSQGDIDFYVDGEFRQTVSTYNLGRQAQMPVYTITGLEDGPHTLKAVKKSGIFMLLDKLRVITPDLISETEAVFDKAAGQQADVEVTEATDRSLSGMKLGAAELAAGTDYTVADGQIAIKKEYLGARPIGMTNLLLTFEGGGVQTLSIAVRDSSAANSAISPTSGSFDKKADAQADVATTMELAGNTLTGIANGETALQLGTDYTVADQLVTIKKEYLAGRPVGMTNLNFSFDHGESQTLSITISDSTPKNSTITPTARSFDKNASAQANISTTIAFNGNSLEGVVNGAANLQEGADYTLSGNQLTIKKEYLAQQPAGMANLTLTFSDGAAQTLAVTVSDTLRGRYVDVNDDDTGISYKGAWQHNRNRGLGDYKDDVHFTEKDNDYLEFTFQGTGIELITEKDPSQGDMGIYIDGEFKQTISTYNDTKQALQTVYSINGLTDGTHTIKVVKKSGFYMLLDQFKVKVSDLLGSDTVNIDKSAASDVTTMLAVDGSNLHGIANGEAVLVQGADYTLDGDEVTIKKEYLAALPNGQSALTFSFKGDHLDDIHYTETNGDSVEYTFKGTGLSFITPKGPEQGEIDIFVDGAFRETVDAHHVSRLTGQTVFSISGLSSGEHTFKAVKKSGGAMLVDGATFSVNSEGPTPTPGTPSPSVPQPEQITVNMENMDGNSGNVLSTVIITRTTQADGKKKDNAVLTAEQVQKAVENLAAGDKSATIIIPDAKDEVSQTTVTVPKEANKLLADAKIGLGITTENAKVFVPNESLQGFADDLYFQLVPVKEDSKKQEIGNRANKEAVVTLVSGDQETSVLGRPMTIETNLQGREVTIVLPLKDLALSEAELKDVGIYIEHSDGTKQLLKGVVVPYNSKGDKGLQFTVDHFSLFSLVKVPGLAETYQHSAYMNGYEDGTFKPDKKITRAEIAAILSRVLTRDANEADIAYSDVSSSSWAKDAISTATKMGLMQGYADGTFGPDKSITRAEMAKLVSIMIEEPAHTGAGFTDISKTWAEDAILAVQSAGIMNGYPDGTFKPNNALTRAEAVSIINRVLDRGPLDGVTLSPWKDVPTGHWAYSDIVEATVNHSYDQQTDGGEQWAG